MQSIRGMRDILPNEIKYWQHIYSTAHKILSLANYHEIRTPILEETSLFLRSIGTGTDIVNKEMYSFSDQGNRSLTLRPEGTASVARAILQHKLHKIQSIQKLWYLGPMFRYERPQKGRQRQFHQLGVECYGSNSPIIDAEAIYLAQQILQSLKCDNYTIEINSIGSLEDRQKYEIALQKYLTPYTEDLDNDSKYKLENNILRILDTKNRKTQEILQDAPQLTNFLNANSQAQFLTLQDYLISFGIKYKINNSLVRGLDYYNDTVFEIKTQLLGTQDTICGGGRYNQLTQQIAKESIPAIGWGIGIERLLLLVQQNITLANTNKDIYLAMQGHEAIKYGLTLVPLFHLNNLVYEVDLSNSSFPKQIQKANKQKANLCIIIGEDEVLNNTITIKWLKTYKQETYKLAEFKGLLTELRN